MTPESRHDRDQLERPLRIEDAVHYLVLRWRRLLLVFGLAAVVLAAITWAARAGEEWPVRGTVSVTFQGIERHKYPTGAPFDYSELTSPDVVASAQRLAGLTDFSPVDLATAVSVVPEIPASTIARWQQQDRQGQVRDDYFPTEFTITVGGGALSRQEKMTLLKSVVAAFQTQLREQLYVTDFRISDSLGNGESWKTTLDPFDLPSDMRQALPVMRLAVLGLLQAAGSDRSGPLGTAGAKSPRDQRPLAERNPDLPIAVQAEADKAFNIRFAELSAQIAAFERGPLAALEALTYSSAVTNNRELVLRTIEHRLVELGYRVQLAQQKSVALNATLSQVDRPQFFMPNVSGANRPVEMNTDVIGTLLRNDYYADLVRQLIEGGEETATLQAERDELARRLARLRVGSIPPSSHWVTLAETAVTEFRALRDRYRQLATGYFDMVAASHVRVTRGPYVDDSGRTAASVLAAAIIGIALLTAVLGVRLHEMVVRARKAR